MKRDLKIDSGGCCISARLQTCGVLHYSTLPQYFGGETWGLVMMMTDDDVSCRRLSCACVECLAHISVASNAECFCFLLQRKGGMLVAGVRVLTSQINNKDVDIFDFAFFTFQLQ